MRANEEIDALEVFAVQPIEYLVSTRFVACLMAILQLYLIGLIGSYVATQLSVTLVFGQPTGTFMHYFETFISGRDIVLSVVKIVVFAGAVTLIHAWYGFTATGGAQGVGEATGRAIRASIVSVVVLDMLFTILFWGGSAGVRISG
jgi:phospholipid/cholesterol/gamma-HCH transport system permease protein